MQKPFLVDDPSHVRLLEYRFVGIERSQLNDPKSAQQ
jgi:hypothetical protein